MGDIKDLMINTSNGEVAYAVLSFGGFLGIGDKYFEVPFNSFTVDRENEQFLLNVDKKFQENSPGFDKDNRPSSAKSDYYGNVTTYYNKNYRARAKF